LEKAVLYDEASKMILQTICPPPTRSGKTWATGALEFHDFYHNNEVMCFRVPSLPTTAPADKAKNCYTYYTMSKQTKLYELDTLLTNKQETRFNKETKKMFATDWVDTKEYSIENAYELVDQKWVLVQCSKHEKPKAPVPLKNANSALCTISQPYKHLPIQYFDSSGRILIADTIWMANYGNATAKIVLLDGPYFKAPRRIGPNERLPIVYKRTFLRTANMNYRMETATNPYEQILDGVTILCDSTKLSAGVEYLLINSQAQQFPQVDSSMHFVIPYKPDERYFVSTFPNKTMKEMGRMSMEGNKRIGEWTFVDSAEKYFIKKVLYTKTLRIGLATEDIAACKILLHYGDSVVEMHHSNGKIEVPRDLKYIRITKDSASVTHKIDFEKMQQYDGVSLALLNPNQPYYYYGPIKYPLDLDHQQYTVRWNPLYMNKQGSSPMQQQLARTSYISSLIKRYPNLKYYNIGGNEDKFHRRSHPEFYVLDFSSCNLYEKNRIFDLIVADSNITALCVLMSGHAPFFCDGIVYFLDNMNKQFDSGIIAKAKQFGFDYKGMHASSSYYQHDFQYTSKIIKQDFFAAFNKFCEATDFMHFRLNTYAQSMPEAQGEGIRE